MAGRGDVAEWGCVVVSDATPREAMPMAEALLAMVLTAESVGHPLPWANAIAAWPRKGFEAQTEVRWAVEDLTTAGLIRVTTAGFVPNRECVEHETAQP